MSPPESFLLVPRPVKLAGVSLKHPCLLPREGLVLVRESRPSSFLSLRSLARRPGVNVAFQGVQRVGPHRLVFRDPFVEFGETLRLECVDSLLRMDRDLDEPCLAEHL